MKHKSITEIGRPYTVDRATGFVAIGAQFRNHINQVLKYCEIHRTVDGEQYIWYNNTTWYL